MKAQQLIEILQQFSPNEQVTGEIEVDDETIDLTE